MANQDYTVRQLLEMEACTNCQLCADICPAVAASKEAKLSALYRMKGLKAILKGRTGLFRKLPGRKGMSEEEVLKRLLPDHLANDLDIIIVSTVFAAYYSLILLILVK